MKSREEKRGISRADYHHECRLIFNGFSTPCVIHNLSLTGFLVEAECGDALTVGERVAVVLEYFCPNFHLSEIECVVVRIRVPYIGLKFAALDYDTLMELKTILYKEIRDDEKINKEILKYFEG